MSAFSPKPINHTPVSQRPRVLVIGDARVMRKAINKILNAEYELIEAGNGEEGWQILVEDEQIVVLLTDVKMPRLDGYSLIERIRAHEQARIRDLPIIVITDAHDDETKERAFACGATDFITKPLDTVQLQTRVRAHAQFDLTTRKLADAKTVLENETTLDPLTEISSRRYFLQRGNQDIAYAKRHGDNLSLIRLDIDKFKAIYHKYGDEFTNQILIWLAKLLTSQCRTEDTVARIGGAEFAIIMPGTSHTEAAVLCNRLLQAVSSKSFTYNNESLNLTISMALVNYSHAEGESIDDLINIADHCLIHVKSNGGNRFQNELRGEKRKPEKTNKDVSPDVPEVQEREVKSSTPYEQLEIDHALWLLQKGETGKLVPHLPDLFIRLLPLLQFGNTKLGLGLGFAIQAFKDKIFSLK